MIYTQKVLFYTYVLATTANLPELRRRRRLDDVLTTSRMPRRFARENFTSGRRRCPISSLMLKVPITNYEYEIEYEYYIRIFEIIGSIKLI